MVAEIYPSLLGILDQGSIEDSPKVRGTGGRIRSRGHGADAVTLPVDVVSERSKERARARARAYTVFGSWVYSTGQPNMTIFFMCLFLLNTLRKGTL